MTDVSRTYHANQAIQLSELIAIKFARQTYGTAPPRIVRVTEPDGPSTEDGAKARQSIVLDATDGSASAIVVGWVDVAARTGQVRSYNMVNTQHLARHNAPVDVSRGEYDRLITELLDFLKTQGLDARLVNAAPSRAPSVAGPPPAPVVAPSSVTIPVLVGMAAGLALGFLLWGSGLIF